MGHVDGEVLVEPEAVYVTVSLRDARKVEALLTARGVDYTVQAEEVGRTFLFGTPRHGAVFYASAAQAAYCREVLAQGGFRHGRIPRQT